MSATAANRGGSARVACNGFGAVTNARGILLAGGQPMAGMSFANAGRMQQAAKSIASSRDITNTPRVPELPPEVSARYSSSRSSGSAPTSARCRSMRPRFSRRSVSTSSRSSIISALVITGRSTSRSGVIDPGSIPCSRRRWNGDREMAVCRRRVSARFWWSRSRPASQASRSMCPGMSRTGRAEAASCQEALRSGAIAVPVMLMFRSSW